MPAWSPRSFRSKLLLLVLLATFAAVMVQSVVIRAIALLEVRPRALSELSTDAAVVAVHSAAALAFNDAEAASETLAALDVSPRVLSAQILDLRGAQFAGFQRAGRAPAAMEPPAGGHRFTGSRLVLARPIEHGADALGTLVIEYDLGRYYDAILRDALVSLVIAVAAISMSMLAALRLQRGLSKPVRELVLASRLISQSKNYTLRVHRCRDDELGALTDAYNEMLAAIEARDAELSASQAELKTSNQQLQQFAYVASHDLQEPLRKIQTFSSLLNQDYRSNLPDEARNFLDRMNAAATRMRSLITALLTYSRVSSKEPDLVDVDLNSVLEGVLSDLEIRVQETGGTVRTDPMPTVHADEMHMRQLFQNLISNALKFHRPGVPPVVTVAVRWEGTGTGKVQCRVTVTDNGIGFEQVYADRIFLPFQRLHGRSEYEGTGIGLAVCKRIVDRYGWSISAKSQPGEGTAFTIEITAGAGERFRGVRPVATEGVAA